MRYRFSLLPMEAIRLWCEPATLHPLLLPNIAEGLVPFESANSGWNAAHQRPLSFPTILVDPPSEYQMSKRKTQKTSKNARKNRPALKAQLATEAVVRSRTNKQPVATATTESEPMRVSNSPQVSIPENPSGALQVHGTEVLPAGTNFSSAMANVPIYQAKLLEIAQSNLQLAFEFTERLVTIRSPAAFVGLVAEFTRKRIDMFWKYSKEMAELGSGEQK
jgi:hypothetical protein